MLPFKPTLKLSCSLFLVANLEQEPGLELVLEVPLSNSLVPSLSLRKRWTPSSNSRLLDSADRDVSRPTSLVTRTEKWRPTFYLNKLLKTMKML
jgi:hypothetical protein